MHLCYHYKKVLQYCYGPQNQYSTKKVIQWKTTRAGGTVPRSIEKSQKEAKSIPIKCMMCLSYLCSMLSFLYPEHLTSLYKQTRVKN